MSAMLYQHTLRYIVSNLQMIFYRSYLLAIPVIAQLFGSATGHAAGLGTWSITVTLPNIPISAALLPNGKILSWSTNSAFNIETDIGTIASSTLSSMYDLVTGAITFLPDTGLQADMFCSGIAYLQDGRVLINGGTSSSHTGIYDFATNRWTNDAPMNIARGYNASVTLSTGEVFTIGGSWSGDGAPKDAEVWSTAGGWRQTGISVNAILAKDINDQRLGYVMYGDTHVWLFAMPNGRVFHAGPSPQMNWFDSVLGVATPAGNRGDDTYSINGVAVMYEPGKIFKTGGAITYTGQYGIVPEPIDANASTYVIDISADYADPSAPPVVRKIAPVNHPRAFANAVVLPDGKVFIAGGQSQPHIFSDTDSVMTPEIWDPATETSTDVAPVPTPRNYHSTALLLADGRVFVGGGGQCDEGCDANHPNFEIYSPPYLFAADGTPAARPVIAAAPTDLVLGQPLNVTVSGPDVTSFALVRMSATTHTVNTNQRRLPLPVIGVTPAVNPISLAAQTNFTLSVPADPGITVPGFYLLFALTADGVPGVAQTIRVEPAS